MTVKNILPIHYGLQAACERINNIYESLLFMTLHTLYYNPKQVINEKNRSTHSPFRLKP